MRQGEHLESCVFSCSPAIDGPARDERGLLQRRCLAESPAARLAEEAQQAHGLQSILNCIEHRAANTNACRKAQMHPDALGGKVAMSCKSPRCRLLGPLQHVASGLGMERTRTRRASLACLAEQPMQLQRTSASGIAVSSWQLQDELRFQLPNMIPDSTLLLASTTHCGQRWLTTA